METTLRSIFFILVVTYITVMQWNFDADKTSTRELKYALEFAVHDASLALDETQLSNGYIVFDQTQATTNFKSSLMDNLKLDNSYVPLSNSFFKSPIQIKLLQFFDDNTPDPNNPGQTIKFPYTYTNSTYNIVDVLNGPCVVAVIETQSPRIFRGTPPTIRQAAVYEYK